MPKADTVVWSLLGYSMVARAIVLERVITLALAGRLSRDFESRLISALRDNTAEALVVAGRQAEQRF